MQTSRIVVRRTLIAAAVGLSLMTMRAVPVAAQTVANVAVQAAPDSLVQIPLDTIVVDSATHKATFRVTNRADFVVMATPVVTFYRLTPDQRHTASGNGGYRDSVAKDSVGHAFGLRSWIDTPSPRLMLQPHATDSVTYQLTIPASLPKGDYVAYVYCRTSRLVPYGQYTAVQDIGGDFSGPLTLIYHAGRGR